MSFILEALKKSETRRRLGQDPVYRGTGRPPGPALLRWASLIAGVLLLLALALAVQVMLWRDPFTATVSVVDSRALPDAPVPGVAASVEPSTLTTPVPPVAAQAPAPEPAARRTPVLADQVQASGSAAATVRTPIAAERSKPSTAAGADRIPWLSSLPDSYRSTLPALTVNIHVYTPDKAGRILYINNRPVQPGATTAGGVVVEEIVPEGVVLRYHGQRFKLPRPS